MSAASVYADASVLAGLMLRDISYEALEQLIGPETGLAFSRFGFGEAVAAIAARTRATHGTDSDAERKISALRTFLADWHEEAFEVHDLDRAIMLAIRASLPLKLPDAIHVSIIESLGFSLPTADRQQERAATHIGVRTVFLTARDSR